ncbi:MAG TPA: hypothetical protein VNZ50_13465 [Hyphomicrobiaceae bacterium]|jgi:hypothetical protein|nr:hypothetical protein [Hyphomicrobiaceae bacterium]
MDHQAGNARGLLPETQATCAVIGGLLLVGLLAYAFASGEWNFAGQMPPEGEFATTWQRLNVPASDETDVARRR